MAGDATAIGDVAGWRLARRHLRLAGAAAAGQGHPEDDEPEDDVEYPDLVLTAGLSPAPSRRASGAWPGTGRSSRRRSGCSCAALGRWLVPPRLAPVTRMADGRAEMTIADGGGRLPEPGTGDELEDLGRAFNDLLARRHEALERQRRFTGDASHQLRTPLAGLLSQVEVVRRRPRPAEEYEQTLDQVHREANRLRQIVESLLFLARPDAEARRCPRASRSTSPPGCPSSSAAGRTIRGPPTSVRGEGRPVWVFAQPALLAQAWRISSTMRSSTASPARRWRSRVGRRRDFGADGRGPRPRAERRGFGRDLRALLPLARGTPDGPVGCRPGPLGRAADHRGGGRDDYGREHARPGTTFLLRFADPTPTASPQTPDRHAVFLGMRGDRRIDVPSLNNDAIPLGRAIDGRSDR